jgi:hypothetical protein
MLARGALLLEVAMRSLLSRSALAALALIGSFALATPASALIINLEFSGKFDDTADPNLAAYKSVANAAAALWQTAATPWNRVTNYSVDIKLTTASMGSGGIYALTHGNFEQAAPNPVTNTRLWESSFITLNEDSWANFFFDPTPNDNAEFNMNQYGGLFGTAINAAQQTMEDALSLIVHELGHALGFMGSSGIGNYGSDAYGWNAYTDFANNLATTNAGPFKFDDVYKGVFPDVPMWGPFHVDGNNTTYQYDTMAAYSNGASGPQIGQRRLISALDTAMIADAFHLIPEPGTLMLFGAALLALAGLHRRAPPSTP